MRDLKFWQLFEEQQHKGFKYSVSSRNAGIGMRTPVACGFCAVPTVVKKSFGAVKTKQSLHFNLTAGTVP